MLRWAGTCWSLSKHHRELRSHIKSFILCRESTSWLSYLETFMHSHSPGLLISAETCTHYLNFAAEDIPDGATEYKAAPPLRSAKP